MWIANKRPSKLWGVHASSRTFLEAGKGVAACASSALGGALPIEAVPLGTQVAHQSHAHYFALIYYFRIALCHKDCLEALYFCPSRAGGP